MWKSYYISFRSRLIQLNFYMGLRAIKPKNPFSFHILGPRPKSKKKRGGVDLMHATSLISHISPCNISYFYEYINSRSISSLPLSLSAESHTHTHISLTTLSQENSLHLSSRSRKLGGFQEDISTNSSSKVRLCLDLWLRFFVLSKSLPNPCKNHDLAS